MSRKPISERLAALRTAARLGEERIPAPQAAELARVAATAGERQSLSDAHTVVGFFGATGSGKSSLFNAVAGADIAAVHVRRPTTSRAQAALWHPEGAGPLLDWLEVDQRHELPGDFAKQAGPLILLDLPDFDSVRSEHREIAARLAGQVDLLVWVVDPEKYADAVIHREFIAPHAKHAAVTLAVLNKTDRLSAAEVSAVTASFADLLRSDGLDGIDVLPASARTGDGIDRLRAAITNVAKRRRAQLDRIEADLQTATAPWSAQRAPGPLPAEAERQLTAALGQAAGVDRIAAAVAASYRKHLGQRTGWLLTSWLLRFRADPLRRLGLREDADEIGVHRSSLPQLSASDRAVANQAVRAYAQRASAGLPNSWGETTRERAEASLQPLPEALDRAVARTRLHTGASRAWSAVTLLQWLSLLAALTGVGWYLLVWFLPSLGLPFLQAEIPLVEGWPVPLLLVLGGVLLGILLGLLGAAFGGLAGAIRRRRARRRLLRQVHVAAREQIIEPLNEERDRYAAFLEAVRTASGR